MTVIKGGVTISKIHFKSQVSNPTSYFNLHQANMRIVNRLIDLYLLFGEDTWYISDEVTHPIPESWIDFVDCDSKELSFNYPKTLFKSRQIDKNSKIQEAIE